MNFHPSVLSSISISPSLIGPPSSPKSGEQEFSSRNAAITFGIIMAIMIPLIIILAYFGKTVYARYQKGLDPIYVPPSRSGSRMRLDDRLDDDMSTIRKGELSTPEYRPNERQFTYRSPVNSEQSQDSLKKRRSYDKIYRTGEPIKGMPEDTFNDDQSDYNDDGTQRSSDNQDRSYFPSVSNQASPTIGDSVGRMSPLYAIPHKSATLRKPPPVPDLLDTKRSQSNPNLLEDKPERANYFRQSSYGTEV